MRSLLFFIVFVCLGIPAQSQQYHFVYLQTDNKQPFYVRIQEKLYSSSSAGYLVIPKLRSGNHILTVGFPKNEWPSQSIPLQITDKDLGYALKNFDNKGWALYNWQTMEVINSNLASSNNNPANSTTSSNDGFSSVLSEVVNTPLQKKQENEPAPQPAPVKELPVSATISEPAPVVPKPQAVVAANTSSIAKISSTSDDAGTVVIYVDKWEGGIDTIQVLIPGKVLETKPLQVAAKETETKPIVAESSTLNDNKDASGKFLDIELPNPNATVAPEKKEVSTPTVEAPADQTTASSKPVMINSDCKQVATEEDFFKSRKKMVGQNTEKAMTEAAIKFFKQKCYTVAQVKNLGALFLTDAGKYEFLETAYPFVLDSHNFSSLDAILTDPFYVNRFKTLVRKP
jgi:Domain of unknown function (DUF4476)